MNGQFADACSTADLVLSLVTLDPAVGGDYLATWATKRGCGGHRWAVDRNPDPCRRRDGKARRSAPGLGGRG